MLKALGIRRACHLVRRVHPHYPELVHLARESFRRHRSLGGQIPQNVGHILVPVEMGEPVRGLTEIVAGGGVCTKAEEDPDGAGMAPLNRKGLGFGVGNEGLGFKAWGLESAGFPRRMSRRPRIRSLWPGH